jgi:hypothetical protein
MVNREWLKQEIATLGELEIEAHRRLIKAQDVYNRAALELRAAQDEAQSLSGVKKELAWQLENMYVETKEA